MDLKAIYDAARTADAEVQRIMADMNAAFLEGTEEGKQKALDLRPSLDTAKAEAINANSLYISMRDADKVSNDAASMFVPVPKVDNTSGREVGDNEMTREDFDLLDASAKMKFVKDGGKILESVQD